MVNLNDMNNQKIHILLACMPKSGSSLLTNILTDLTGFLNWPLVRVYSQNEQDIYLPKLVDGLPFSTITQQHVRATKPNLELMKMFSIKPIILVRNLYDIVLSYRDHLINESPEVPAAYFNEQFLFLDEKTQIDMIIDLVIPWYFSFYSSWFNACYITKELDSLWLSYEEMILNKEAAIGKIIDFYRIRKDSTEINNSIEKVTAQKDKIRFNKGVAGRGKTGLNEIQKARIKNRARYYPWCDFSIIGL